MATEQSTNLSTDSDENRELTESTTRTTTAEEGSNDTPSSSYSSSSSSSSIIEDSQALLLFRCFVVIIGLVGCSMNGLVLRVLMSKRLRSQPSNILIINQVLLDLLSCTFLIACYVVKIPPTGLLYLDGRWGFLVCVVLTSDSGIFVFQAGSIVNLVLIAIERYLKIVHMIFHRTHFRKWMSFVAIAFTWTSGILVNFHLIFTAEVIDGQCLPYHHWSTEQASLAYGLFINIWEFVVPLALFGYCYGRILIVVRRRSQVRVGNYPNGEDLASGLQTMARRSQLNVIWTMLSISVVFVVSWFPNVVWYFLTLINYTMQNSDTVYYASLLLIFLNVCLNPFIYAVKHDAVKKHLRHWFRLDRSQQSQNQEPISFSVTAHTTDHA